MSGTLIGGGTDEARDERQGVTGLLGAGGEDAAEDSLGMSAGGCAVAAENLAVDNCGTDGLFGGPVRRFDTRFMEKRQDLIGVPSQVVLECQVAVMRETPFEQSIQPFFQSAAGPHGPCTTGIR